MTKEALKSGLNAQRYFLISLIGSIEAKDYDQVQSAIESLWGVTEELGEQAGVQKELKGYNDIIQHARDITELERIYELEIQTDR